MHIRRRRDMLIRQYPSIVMLRGLGLGNLTSLSYGGRRPLSHHPMDDSPDMAIHPRPRPPIAIVLIAPPSLPMSNPPTSHQPTTSPHHRLVSPSPMLAQIAARIHRPRRIPSSITLPPARRNQRSVTAIAVVDALIRMMSMDMLARACRSGRGERPRSGRIGAARRARRRSARLVFPRC